MSAPFPAELQHEFVKRYEKGESARKIAESLGLHTTSVTRVLKRNGINLRKCAGSSHHSWKGGRVEKGDGYVGVWMPEHERADNRGYVYEHTLIISDVIGRLPNKDEVVHHINLDKKDNRPENLYLCGHREHTSIHRQFERLVKPLLDRGVVEFDRLVGEYKLTEVVAVG